MHSLPHKLCPKCGQLTALDASQCGRCGHIYRTQFVPPDKTKAFPASPACAPRPRGMPVWMPRSPVQLLAILVMVAMLIAALVFIRASIESERMMKEAQEQEKQLFPWTMPSRAAPTGTQGDAPRNPALPPMSSGNGM